jgi:hypothetical protein
MSDDPYSDFVVRVMNSCRIALAQGDTMSRDETMIVEKIRATLIDLDPEAVGIRHSTIIIRP